MISLTRQALKPRQRHADRFPLGSQCARQTTMALAAGSQNSHRNGGRIFLTLVADPIGVPSCTTTRGGKPRPNTQDLHACRHHENLCKRFVGDRSGAVPLSPRAPGGASDSIRRLAGLPFGTVRFTAVDSGGGGHRGSAVGSLLSRMLISACSANNRGPALLGRQLEAS